MDSRFRSGHGLLFYRATLIYVIVMLTIVAVLLAQGLGAFQ